MTATAEKLAPEATRPSIAAHEENLRRWQSKIASLGEELAKAEQELEKLETAAAKAALEGTELPDMGPAASKARALKRARAMASEEAQQAEQELKEARQAEAEAARVIVAKKIVQEARGLDDALAEVGARLEHLARLVSKEYELSRASGATRRRRMADLSPTALAGACMHHAPELLASLNSPRPPADLRQPLAATLAARYAHPHLQEVK